MPVNGSVFGLAAAGGGWTAAAGAAAAVGAEEVFLGDEAVAESPSTCCSPCLGWLAGRSPSSGAVGPSHVLRALGWSDDRMEGALRIGIGRFTTDEEIARGGELIVRAAAQVGQAMAAP
jgi:hypothetical protein